MDIPIGTRLGRYEIRAFIGAGGMGQVYRAHDTSLGRDVAIKSLPPVYLNPDRLRRFEQEARATSALNHPNILAIFDIGTYQDGPFVVSELLEGQTLRERLAQGPLPARKAIDYAKQIGRGLAAAHEKGIVHRDLKPENVYLTNDGHVKILDFGLAKLIDPVLSDDELSQVETKHLNTEPGVVLGTAGYMSPEQVRGNPADQRSDIFSFGAVLYEMVVGVRPFHGDSSVETMNAILKEEPPPIPVAERGVSLLLQRVISHCLEKQPQDRFQTARDLVFNLDSITDQSSIDSSLSMTTAPSPVIVRRSWIKWAVAGVIGAILLGAVFFAGRYSSSTTLPTYTRLTFRHGAVYTARFTPDGKGIFFSATWDGNPVEISYMRVESSAVQSVGSPDTQMLSVSPSGDMAVLLNEKYLYHFVNQGTLGRMSLAGGSPREMLENVQDADWNSLDNSLAIVRAANPHVQLEFPMGKKLYETDGYVSHVRVSPKGDRVAFLDHPLSGDSRGTVAVIDSSGQVKRLTDEFTDETGLAWAPSGDEIWFTASESGEAAALYAVTLTGKLRIILRTPISLRLHDISKDGDALITGNQESTPVTGLAPGETHERDLSWLSSVRITDLSPDGTSFIFSEAGQGSGTNYSLYLRKTDGSPAIRLGSGHGHGRSPDGKSVISILLDPPQIVLLPIGAGEAKPLERFGIEQYGYGATWLPDGKSVVFIGKEKGHALRTYVQDIAGGPPRPVTPEGITGHLVSPDGKFVVGRSVDEKKGLYSITGGDARDIPGVEADDRVIGWANAESLYIFRDRERPLRIFKLNVSNGRKELQKEILPGDLGGVLGSINVLLTPDAKSYVYAFTRQLSDLYLVKGLH
ncbi:MAG TPA: protein kinase [Pyrinomonadaceae bacterium]|nr:protein kinase [Pyrinomonadaceae bacterium]